MEIALNNHRIRNYVKHVLNDSERKVEKHYIENFNPFYKWRVGNLYGEKIGDAIISLHESGQTGNKITKTVIGFWLLALLAECCKKVGGNKHPADYSVQNWLTIRYNLEEQKKNERENTFGHLSHNENIDERTRIKENRDYCSDDLAPDGIAEVEPTIVESIFEELNNILNDLYQGDWDVRPVADRSKNNFQYHFAIVNLYIIDNEENIFEQASQLVEKYVSENTAFSFVELKTFELEGRTNYFIDGYFNLEE